MATNAERSAAICDAIINGTSTLQQQHILAEAIHGEGAASYAALSNAEKAAIIPQFVRVRALAIVDQYRAAQAKAAIVPAKNDLPEGT